MCNVFLERKVRWDILREKAAGIGIWTESLQSQKIQHISCFAVAFLLPQGSQGLIQGSLSSQFCVYRRVPTSLKSPPYVLQ